MHQPVDDATVAALRTLGGVSGIAISHPHYYSSMVDWSRALGGVPVYLHAADSQWVVRQDPAIVFWDGAAREVAPGITLVHCGGHFAGGTVLHWTDGADGLGALLSGDIIMVGQDRRTVSFMYSYPNYIPLGPMAVASIGEPAPSRWSSSRSMGAGLGRMCSRLASRRYATQSGATYGRSPTAPRTDCAPASVAASLSGGE